MKTARRHVLLQYVILAVTDGDSILRKIELLGCDSGVERLSPKWTEVRRLDMSGMQYVRMLVIRICAEHSDARIESTNSSVFIHVCKSL